jgi:hypothetical protein
MIDEYPTLPCFSGWIERFHVYKWDGMVKEQVRPFRYNAARHIGVVKI